jgi:hypothetical protein
LWNVHNLRARPVLTLKRDRELSTPLLVSPSEQAHVGWIPVGKRLGLALQRARVNLQVWLMRSEGVAPSELGSGTVTPLLVSPSEQLKRTIPVQAIENKWFIIGRGHFGFVHGLLLCKIRK